MILTVNGDPTDLPAGTKLPRLLAILEFDMPRGVAVAVDGEVVPRSGWADFELRDGMRVEVLRAVQGG